MPSLSVKRNHNHNNVMFIYQLVPMEQIALSLSHGGFKEGTHKEEGKTNET
jgi:hypothetical protein